MTDRELLELAAKAAKVPAYWSVDGTMQNRPIFVVKAGGKMGTMPYEVEWNPLNDDAQTLRLAVNLGIDMYFWVSGVEAQHSDIPPQPIQHYKDDRAAATRRAVTLVAAEIGKTRSD